MEKKVVYLNICDENVTVNFDLVITTEVGAYFYSENVDSVFKDLVLFLPITKQFVIVNRDCEVHDTPLC